MPHQTLDVAIVADDLTGALDTAAPFAEVGFATRVLLDTKRIRSNAPPGIRVLSLTTESRHLSSRAAGDRVFNATRDMLVHSPYLLLKKIDSTLRGNVAAEILGCLSAAGKRHAMIAPAVPRQGRSMRAGEVFVRGMPLCEMKTGADVPFPSRTAPLPKMLNSATNEMTVHVWSSSAEFLLSKDSGIHAYVTDCESEADLDAIARFVLAYRDELLPVGASGLATALARQIAETLSPLPANVEPRRRTKGPVLFVVGSRTAESAAQTAQLLAAGARDLILPLLDPSAAVMPIAPDIDSENPSVALIVRPHSTIEPGLPAFEVARLLGSTAADLVRRLHIDKLVIVGGDTAYETFRALGIEVASVVGEIMPGAAQGEMLVDGRRVTFVTKAGGFGGSDAFTEILRYLK